MAVTYSGSGKFVKLVGGVLSSGQNTTTYYSAQAASTTMYSRTYYGIALNANLLSLTNVNELSIGDYQGYTGNLRVYTNFYYPFDPLIWDTSWDTSNIRTSYVTFRFVRGVLVDVS